MTSSAPRIPAASLLLAAAGVAYPFVVHAALGRVPAGALVLMALALVGARVAVLRGGAAARPLLPPLVGVAVVTGLLALADAGLAAKAYPVAMSLAFAAAFGLSVLRPPSLIEIFASVKHPDPPAPARAYMRRVSLVWCVFCLGNAAASAATALWADIGVWALYNGLVSYLLMGALFLAELAVRRRRLRRLGRP